MKTFFAVLKNDYLRMLPRWAAIGVFTLFTLCTMLFAVYLTEVQHFNAHIAYIPQGSSMSAPQSSPSLTVTVLKTAPPRSALMQQQYDAYVTPGPSGEYNIETLKNQNFEQLLTLLLKDPNADLSALQPGRGVGVNILGFMMMFVLTFASFNLFVFADDKEQGQLRRVATAPVSLGLLPRSALLILPITAAARISAARYPKTAGLGHWGFATAICRAAGNFGAVRHFAFSAAAHPDQKARQRKHAGQLHYCAYFYSVRQLLLFKSRQPGAGPSGRPTATKTVSHFYHRAAKRQCRSPHRALAVFYRLHLCLAGRRCYYFA